MIILAYLLSLIFFLIVTYYFFRMCNDIHSIKEMINSKTNPKEEVKGPSKFPPTKTDVNEFKKKAKLLRGDALESLINSYNETFDADFHQYID